VFKEDKASQWKRQKFDPSPHQNLNRSSQKLACVIMFCTAPGTQNFVAIGSGVSASRIRDFVLPFDVTSFYVRS